jgi:hypothetical protein
MSSHSAFSVPPSIPAGGATGTVLAKRTASDYDTLWQAIAAGGGLTYKGDYVPGSYNDGDIVVYNGIAYVADKPTSNAPVPWTQQGTPYAPSGLVPIADILLASPQVNIDIQNIPQNYASLLLYTVLRDDSAGAGLTAASVRFNGDAGANYDVQYLEGQGSTAGAGESYANTSLGLPLEATNGNPAGLFCEGEFSIPSYAGVVANKSMLGVTTSKIGVSSGNERTRTAGGHWRSSAAINRITITPGLGSNFVAGSRVTLYGMLGTLPAIVPPALSAPVPATTLPVTPQDGQQAILVDNTAAPTFSWLLQWSATAARWIGLPGSAAQAEIITQEGTTSVAYVDLTTVGPSIVVPRAGSYEISFGTLVTASIVNYMFISPKLGAAAAQDNDGILWASPSATVNGASMARTIRRTLAAGDTVKLQYRVNTASNVNAQNRWLSIKPVLLT